MTDETRAALASLLEAAATKRERTTVEALLTRTGLKPQPRRIMTQEQLGELAEELGVRTDWHEPDEQDVTARIEGYQLDNAGSWPSEPGREAIELCVVIQRKGVDVAAVNIATLLAWASADYRF